MDSFLPIQDTDAKIDVIDYSYLLSENQNSLTLFEQNNRNSYNLHDLESLKSMIRSSLGRNSI
jgi:hypothetical protein